MTSVHRAVLSEKSDYFKSMLSGRFTESTASSIDLSTSFHDVNELNIVLDYMYTGAISLSEENVAVVLNAASLFLMDDLQTACSKFLLARIIPSTCLSTLVLADRYSLKITQAGCLEFMKTWFPLLCESEEAVSMPPDCLKLIADENIFAFTPGNVKKAFLQKWNDHFKEICNGNVQLTQEMEDLVKSLLSGLYEAKGSRTRTQCGDSEMNDVLLAVVTPLMNEPITHPETDEDEDFGPISKCFEILAFVPAMKTWKLILRHSVREIAGQRTLYEFIGISKKAAFFWLGPPTSGDAGADCILSIDVVTHKESLIKVPQHVNRVDVSNYFLWEDTLCNFAPVDGRAWSLLRNRHDHLCEGHCSGECWDMVCQLPRPENGIDGDKFLAKVFQEKLYLWMLNDEMKKEMSFFCITPNPNEGNMYEALQIPSPCTYTGLPYHRYDMLRMSSIAVDRERSVLQFTAKFDSEDNYFDNVQFSQKSHPEVIFTYDIVNKQWHQGDLSRVRYPKDVPRFLSTTCTIEALESIEKSDFRLILDDWQEGCVYSYYARSTSPYNTHIWKVDSGEQTMPCRSNPSALKQQRTQWELLSHVPCHIAQIAFWKVDEFSSEHLQGFPRASFIDFSEVVGQSDLSMLKRSPEYFVNLDYGDQLLKGEDYANMRVEMWEASF